MPPFYDIYGFSKNRNVENLNRFIEHFSDRKKIENCEGCELIIQPYKDIVPKEILISVNNLSEVVQYGIKNKNHGFAFYLGPPGLKNDIKSLILKFTYDSGIILGISIEEKNEVNRDNYSRAFELETEIKEFLFAAKTSIQFEYPPADNEDEFDENKRTWKKMHEQQLKKMEKK